MSRKNVKEEQIIKETKYCKIINQGKVGEGEYTYSIEKIYIRSEEHTSELQSQR